MSVLINPLPVKPTFFVNGNTFTTGVTGLNLQWYLNGLPIPGETGTTHIAQVTGTYQLCGTDINGCVNCSDTLIYLGLGTSEIHNSGFQVYPNPSDGRFTLLFETSPHNKRTLMIYESTGKLIQKTDLEKNLRYVQPAGLKSGIYLMIIEDDNNRVYQKIIIR